METEKTVLNLVEKSGWALKGRHHLNCVLRVGKNSPNYREGVVISNEGSAGTWTCEIRCIFDCK